MNTKFKIDEEVFFMRYDTPSKGLIKGIAIVEGTFEDSSFKRTGTPENASISYSIEGVFSSVEEHKVFTTKEDLINSLFSNL